MYASRYRYSDSMQQMALSDLVRPTSPEEAGEGCHLEEAGVMTVLLKHIKRAALQLGYSAAGIQHAPCHLCCNLMD